MAKASDSEVQRLPGSLSSLKSLEYTETEQEEKRAISFRLANIIKARGMDEAVIASSLRFFGTLQRSYLIPILKNKTTFVLGKR